MGGVRERRDVRRRRGGAKSFRDGRRKKGETDGGWRDKMGPEEKDGAAPRGLEKLQVARGFIDGQ